MEKLNEPKWKNDLVKRIWQHARAIGCKDKLPDGLARLVWDIRNSCDRCGVKQHPSPMGPVFVTRYQCCWVHTEEEDYCPQYCDTCHNKLRKERPHETVSV